MDFQEFKKSFTGNLYDRYAVTMDLNDIVGGVPADPKMIAGWINATNSEKSDEARKALVDATKEELPPLAEDKEARSWCRFKRDETGPYLEGRCVKAALKEGANVIKSLVKVRGKDGTEAGAKALKSKVAECVFVDESKVYLLDGEGKPLAGELKTEERPVHAMTAQGPRTSLKRVDVAYGVQIKFTVLLAKTGAVSETALYSILTYLERGGLGTDRSQGRGTGRVVSVEKI